MMTNKPYKPQWALTLCLLLAAVTAKAQITIGGNVYGGGNAGDTDGNTTVTVYAGDLNSVFGGARQANVGGRAFTHIDGEHASNYILINYVYGGNDIAGNIGTNEELTKTIPAEIEKEIENKIDSTWNAFVRISSKMNAGETAVADDNKPIYIGQLFGGGNGDYDYETQEDNPYYGLSEPNLAKTYLEVMGGSIVYAFGGGNNATVTEKTAIYVDNPSKVVSSIKVKNGVVSDDDDAVELLTTERIAAMGYNPGYTYPTSDAFQIGSFFGGNNTAEMKIRPRWNLQSGKIRNLYSGGNKGDMTSPDGLLLQIEEQSTIEVDNVYGGCRMADVTPKRNGVEQEVEVITEDDFGNPLYFPNNGMSARIRIKGGRVNNVYGGNDITGRVAGGNSIGIYTTIYGDIYGGGNGSYPYTDNPDLKDDPTYGELYYDKTGYASSVEALNDFRPDAEQVSILVTGTDNHPEKPTIIHGSIYLGGNSASLWSTKPNPTVELKIGPYVIADNVYLGNNGAHMAETHEGDAANWIHEGVLRTMASTTITSNGSKFNSIDLTDATTFAKYMEGVSLSLMPSVVFAKGDPTTYEDYTSYIGSFFCGGNVGSMNFDGKTTIDFDKRLIIYNKLVGGCNNANVPATDYNAAYEGGYIGDAEAETGDKLQLNLSGLKIQPKRWKKKYYTTGNPTPIYTPTPAEGESFDTNPDFTDYVVDANGNHVLEWNTVSATSATFGYEVAPVTDDAPFEAATDLVRRLTGGNIYGGCFNSGHINGNVIININETLMERDKLFDVASDEVDCLYENTERGSYTITERNTGVILSEQGMDVLGTALNVFGGGYGAESEIWGSTTINLNKGYVFQIFGGGEAGAIGKKEDGEYSYDAKYSTYINLHNSNHSGVARGAEGDSPDMAECEFIYGGGFEGTIAGNTHVNLGNGRIFNSFAGSCNADILGHTATYMGQWTEGSTTKTGFPWIRDHIYGGNDLGGSIKGNADFTGRIRSEVEGMVADTYKAQVSKATAYMEYTQGRVRYILGGCFGDYDYEDPAYIARIATTGKTYLHNTFINFRPIANNSSSVERIFGAGEGYPGDRDGDKSQDHSYVLIDIPAEVENFKSTEVFGAGPYDGLGMRWTAAETFADDFKLEEASAVIDLMRGRIGAAYGGSLDEGVTRRTMVNVPEGSTIIINNIFGGAYGNHILPPCDVYEANVNYHSAAARVNGKIYGGNNNVRRTIYATVNINVPVLAEDGRYGTVFGAGKGMETWAEYTEVNLEDGAQVWEVYGGSEEGNVLNAESVERYMQLYKDKPADKLLEEEDTEWDNDDRWDGDELTAAAKEEWKKVWKTAWTIDGYYTPDDAFTGYVTNTYTNLENSHFVRTAEMDDRDYTGYTDAETKARIYQKYNTNVIISEGATVSNYAYGGGYGKAGADLSGGVLGTTYIALLGGTVTKDIYAAGTQGQVSDVFHVGAYSSSNTTGFTASANAYIKGGTCRNVYGGGWAGAVGFHTGTIDAPTDLDVPGETHVVIGDVNGTTFTNGIPAIERDAYGGGEGGAVFGTTHITLNNGFIGYRYFADEEAANADYAEFKANENNVTAPAAPPTCITVSAGSPSGSTGYYQEKLHDETWNGDGTNRLYDSGNIFGGGYIDNSSVDRTNVTVYGGHVRNALFGGGEIAAIGRGVIHASGEDNSVRTLQGIYKAGHTCVTLYGGNVHRNVFGGGRGYNNLGEGGTLYSDGFVFGQTEVNIYGGEVGTEEELANDNGNVFGGGDIGYVYSAYENASGQLCYGKKSGSRYNNAEEGYYYKYENGNFLTDGTEKYLTEDCKVLIEPWCKVKHSTISYNGRDYAVGDYVPTAYLNTLGNKNATEWTNLDDFGIIIHNAVFAGGNTSSGSSKVYANATSIFGNATASVHDVYHRDLITVGTGHVGGLYGDGNLTFVDGYRELNITNYGTDYYTIDKEITLEQYEALPDREKAYYELRYKCVKDCTDKDGTNYYRESTEHPQASTISADDLITLFEGINGDNNEPMVGADGKPQTAYWVENGVCSRYAGRIMNTIQRADFCGVFGSRMVMQGARDRVPEIVDYTNYTINRVREVSLNKKLSVIPGDASDDQKKQHGNYFGIYNIVNYLGALTSDVDFHETVRETTATESKYKDDNYGTTTYEGWKGIHKNDRTRNNGNSHNQVALASGVYLELTSEQSTGTDLYEKKWGYITGVVELDLINVQVGIGGGFVYAKNEHGVRSSSGKTHTTLTSLNANAVSQKSFTYATADISKNEWQTSGNFVHSTQVIIDDCYNISGKYLSEDGVPAHYWYIKGDIYVYDQYISAYTGSPNAYSESVEIPLTITAASHGTMKLLNVQPNYYAYYASAGNPLVDDQKIVINEVTYYKNDPISYWTWNLLSASEKALFVPETYVVIGDCKIGDTEYKEGTVLLPNDYTTLKNSSPSVSFKNDKGEYTTDAEKGFDYFFRSSNNMSHDTGYILTYKVNNPTVWDTWYTKAVGDATDKTQNSTYGNSGPTYHKTGDAGLLGQRNYKESEIISQDVYNTYQNVKTNHSTAIPAEGQATFVPAYYVTSDVSVTEGGSTHYLNEGAIVSETYYTNSMSSSNAVPAYVCTSTIQLSPTEFIYQHSMMTEAQKDAYKTANPDLATEIDNNIVPAYYCTAEGLYGGDYYETDHNYRGLAAWSSMSETDRQEFTFNYDALDLLIDPQYGGTIGAKYQYDSADADLDGANANRAHYSLAQPVDYTATYNGSETDTYNGVRLGNGNEYTRAQYESLPNEKRHYAGIVVNTSGTYYVVNTAFQQGNSTYAVGSTMEQSTYNSLGSLQSYVTPLTFSEAGTYYYCREAYEITTATGGTEVTGLTNVEATQTGTYNTTNSNVPAGLVISATNYTSLVNKQTDFTIHGIAPSEVSTLYVSRESDIFDLSTEKIITVIYQYDYEEADENGNIAPVSERHVLNIHVQFKSGIPQIEDIKTPPTVLPGDYVSLRDPAVTPGAYEIMGGGWEIFQNEDDAESHTNGVEYSPNVDPLYWYQDEYYVAYYAKTYLGKTYSNHVPLSVANYHDMDRVMQATTHHMYVDNPRVKRNSKIYIDNRDCLSDPTKSELDLFYDFFTLSTGATLTGHEALDSHVGNCQNLDFILNSDVAPKAYTTWTSIGTTDNCFEGRLHGNGYTVSGLTNSLFGKLCGNIYNIGVMGSFTSGGIANSGSGHIENTWVSTTATPTGKPVIADVTGNPYVYNSYYPEEQNWTDHAAASNLDIIEKPMKDFVNGEVAYLLNSNYLQARYLLFGNKSNAASSDNKVERPVFFSYPDGTFDVETVGDQTKNKEYTLSYTTNTTEWSWHSGNGFVEDYMGTGDFRYSDGIIPKENDVSYTVGADGKELFIPVFPDDYIYFGQTLSYDLYNSTDRPAHDMHPMGIEKYHTTQSGDEVDNSKHLLLNIDAQKANRVFRAPAYFRNGTFGRSVTFNASAAFAGSYTKDGVTYKPHEGLTAIDLTGNGDITGYSGVVPGDISDFKDRANKYGPLLDYYGLDAIRTSGITKNLLTYAPTADAFTETSEGAAKAQAAATSTLSVLTNYFNDPEYSETHDTYRTVDAVTEVNMPKGHLVQMGGGFGTGNRDYTAVNDHFLVDKQDFNAPFPYTFAEGKRMWYQRTPDLYVDTSTGWEAISLPFTAELVTTQDKGEITHFYSGSPTINNSTKIGAEYWLREYRDITALSGSPAEAEALFTYPDNGSSNKTVTNTFLWDYYYQGNHSHQDANADQYQTYYKTARILQNYAYLTNGTPYLIGFPSVTYYEFDLSGEFEAKHTGATAPEKLDQQVITFASAKSDSPALVTIYKSDDETGVTYNGYTFRPSYLNETLTTGYVMNDTGSAYTALSGSPAESPAEVVPAFRPYFIKSTQGAPAYSHIYFSNEVTSLRDKDNNPDMDDDVFETLDISSRRGKIIVSSSLRQEAEVGIFNPGGALIDSYTIKPGETIETNIYTQGVYIVRAHHGRYIKKLVVK